MLSLKNNKSDKIRLLYLYTKSLFLRFLPFKMNLGRCRLTAGILLEDDLGEIVALGADISPYIDIREVTGQLVP